MSRFFVECSRAAAGGILTWAAPHGRYVKAVQSRSACISRMTIRRQTTDDSQQSSYKPFVMISHVPLYGSAHVGPARGRC